MITRKAFVLEEPRNLGVGYMSRLTVEPQHIAFVASLPYIASVEDLTIARNDNYHIWFDKRYDYEEAWLDLYEQLELETSRVNLSNVWGMDES